MYQLVIELYSHPGWTPFCVPLQAELLAPDGDVDMKRPRECEGPSSGSSSTEQVGMPAPTT